MKTPRFLAALWEWWNAPYCPDAETIHAQIIKRDDHYDYCDHCGWSIDRPVSVDRRTFGRAEPLIACLYGALLISMVSVLLWGLLWRVWHD